MPQVSAPLLGANLGCKLSRALLPLLPHVPYHPRFPLSFAHMPGGGAQHHGRLFHLAALPRHAVHRQVGHHRRQRHLFVPLGKRTVPQKRPRVTRGEGGQLERDLENRLRESAGDFDAWPGTDPCSSA